MEHRIEIKNAGIVIVWPYLDRFFQMLGMTDKGSFKTEENAVRAVHLIQYLVTGLIHTLGPDKYTMSLKVQKDSVGRKLGV